MTRTGRWLQMNRFVSVIAIGAFGFAGIGCTSNGMRTPQQATMPAPQAVASQPRVDAQTLVRATSRPPSFLQVIGQRHNDSNLFVDGALRRPAQIRGTGFAILTLGALIARYD